MSDPLQSVGRGSRRTLMRADTHNALVNAARAHKSPSPRSGHPVGTEPSLSACEVLVRNQTGATIPRFGPVALYAPISVPTLNYAAFAERLVFRGLAFSPSIPNWAIAQQSIPHGQIGRAIASGLSPAKLWVTAGEEDLRYAEPRDNTRLQPVESGQAEIVWKEDGTGEVNAVVRVGNTPSSGEGIVYLAIVVAPSVNASVESSYVVNIYGTTVASLFDAPTTLGQVVLQSPATRIFWRGEVVGVARTGSTWSIIKFLQLPIAYTVEANQICVRTRRSPSFAPDNNTVAEATNILVDLVHLLEFLDGGTNQATGVVSFTFGPYGGWAFFRQDRIVPVRWQSGWNLAQLLYVGDDAIDARAFLFSPVDPSAATNGQDTIGIGSLNHSPTEVSASGALNVSNYRYLNAIGSVVSTTQITAGVSLTTGHDLSTPNISDLYAFRPDLPSIPDGVDSDVLMLGRFVAAISDPASSSSGGFTNHTNPLVSGWRAMTSIPGQTMLGSYTFIVFNPGGLTITIS